MVLQQLERDLQIHASKLRKKGRINRMEKIVKKLNFIRRKIKLKQVLEDKFQINLKNNCLQTTKTMILYYYLKVKHEHICIR